MQTDGVTIGELWDRRAARDPAHVYCRFEDRDWTVGELDERINRLANALLAQGLVKGDRVALMLPSHPDHIVAIFALAKAGLVRVPVNVHLKGASLDFVFDRFEPRAIIADRAYSEVLAPIVGRLPGLKVVWRGTDAPADFAAIIDAASPARPAVSVMADDIIAITPSSGTTGEPKGVLKTDRSLRAGPMGTLALTGARSGDVLLLWEPLHHGAGVAVLIAAVMEPLTLAMVEKFSASRFWDQVRRYDVTHIHYLGGVLPLLLKQPGSPLDRDHKVRMAWGGGCPVDVWRAFEQRFGVVLREGYGLSEMTTFVTINPEGRLGSCGRPLPFYDVRLQGEDGVEVPVGEPGEIVVRPREEGLAFKGYFRMPEAGAALVKDGWFSTGDLARRDEDGFLFYAGRRKDSVRRRGVNISAWEVERIILTHDEIEECALIGVPSEMGDDDLKLFIRTAEGRSTDPLALLRWCESRMPYFQIPRYVETIAEFPKTPTQRIKKSDLSRGVDSCFDLERSGHKIGR
ncbi:AMP-binding protein [Bosea sp. (in: a-proteobacteria)]|uniref:AMP-binding protein n=1 Tax=Bosea sp. (in: a-proteobacteria) TaxID=1871050 RepID=UPI001AC588CF|nr:AMP-binding protein [Bosea sp. (in: a-proteobacteria)]MBN9444662.1 AMP-binding protein [Bosea sp. (in: a-proteobacteria)]